MKHYDPNASTRAAARVAVSFLIPIAILALPVAVQADSPPTAGVFFDMAGTRTSLTVTSYPAEVVFYVVANGLPSDVKSYEVGLEYAASGSLWLDLYQLRPTWGDSLCEEDWFDLCMAADPCLPAIGGRALLAQFELFVHSPVEDYTICVGPTSEGHGPWFVPCGGDTTEMFRAPYQGCAVLNPVEVEIPVGAETRSWSRIKALYDPR
jgi:hypothetical protein